MIDSTGYFIFGNVFTSGCQSFNFLTILSIILFLMGEKQSVFIIGSVIIFFCVINLFFFTKKRYDQLSENYKEEKHKKVKGYLIALYVLLSFSSFFATLMILDV